MTNPRDADGVEACPCCGGRAREAGPAGGLRNVVCDPCGLQTRFHRTRKAARAAWNTRAPSATERAAGRREGLGIAGREADKIAKHADRCVARLPPGPCQTSAMGASVGARSVARAIRARIGDDA